MTSGLLETTTPVDHALTQFRASLDQLIAAVDDGGLDHHDDFELVGFLQGFEVERNRMALIDHQAVRQAEARSLAERLGQSRLTTVLTNALRISAGEASRRVRAAAAIGDRVSMLGDDLPPSRPVLAVAQRAGQVSPEQVAVIERALDKVDRRGFDPAEVDAAEAFLTEQASTFGPKDLKQLADRVVDRIDPDGTLPDDELNQDRRFFELRPAKDGSYRGEFHLTGTVGAKLAAVLGPLARARADLDATHDGHPLGLTDLRTHSQRMHDAVEEVCDRLLRSGQLPDSGGTPATVIITIDLADLLDRVGYGVTSDGTLIPTATALQLADQADLIPTFVTISGAVLDQGRTRRIATPAQTYALIARDAGCSFPRCTHPPEWCERHHIVDWASGGLTNLANLTLICRFHHHNFAKHGWTCTLNADGLPEWTPPRWVDPAQTPLVNHRIRARLALRKPIPA